MKKRVSVPVRLHFDIDVSGQTLTSVSVHNVELELPDGDLFSLPESEDVEDITQHIWVTGGWPWLQREE